MVKGMRLQAEFDKEMGGKARRVAELGKESEVELGRFDTPSY